MKCSEHMRELEEGVQFFLFMLHIQALRLFLESSCVFSPWLWIMAGMTKNETPLSRPLRLWQPTTQQECTIFLPTFTIYSVKVVSNTALALKDGADGKSCDL